MPFQLKWTPEAAKQYNALREAAQKSVNNRKKSRKGKASKAEGLFKQVKKAVDKLLSPRNANGDLDSPASVGSRLPLVAFTFHSAGVNRNNPKQSGLRSHQFSSMPNPFTTGQPVWESYAQNNTPGAYRIFWCYGPEDGELGIISITPHP